ncbi:hypothetical protein SETIT_2G417200v2 [Setaria italica]|uniref:F-box domain-containing protein n=2 Tax=Setaria italica TaxID=4555 RepID=A0A368Q933_SETIT|nr:uncharacterized protein LOC101761693 [Setaria italica]RCV14334.1 hypothetical protein SETIT_2G417200v2 [Setaria italica]
MAPAPAERTIDDLPDHVLTEVMLRVPTPAALVHAAAVSKRWRGVIVTSTGKFLEDYRARHKSSPFLGLYIPREFGGLPSFQMADSIQSADDDDDRDLDLQHAAAKALTFILGGLERHREWRLLDCYNGRLLLARGGESLEVYNPLSRERISVGLPQDFILPDGFSTCLLQGHGDHGSSFRVVSVQSHRRDRMVHVVEYDSCRKSWNHHPDRKILKNIEGTQREVMHAGNLILCKYTGASLLLLDTGEMQFSVLPLPGDNNPKRYAIGEMEDGVCCLAAVEPVGKLNIPHLRVWRLEKLDWKLEKAMKVAQVLGKHAPAGPLYYQARKVTNGMAVLCSTGRNLHFVIDLKTFRVMEKFEFNRDLPAFPMQMHWPPAFSVATISGELSTPKDGAAVRGGEAEGAETDGKCEEEAAETSSENEDAAEDSDTEGDAAEESPPPSPPSRGRCCKRVGTPDLTPEDDEAEEGKKLLADGEVLAVALQSQKNKSMNPPVATISVMNPGSSEGAETDFRRRRQLGERGNSPQPPPDHLRCRRSDGKKWRCSGRALPTVSFCEYHYVKANKGKKLPADGEVLAVALQRLKNKGKGRKNCKKNFCNSCINK